LPRKSTWRELNKQLESPHFSSNIGASCSVYDGTFGSAHGGASGSGTLGHGAFVHGRKRKLPPHEQT